MSDDSILECPSCGTRLKVKAASLRALKEVKCAKCRAPIPTSALAAPPRSVAAVPSLVAQNPDVIRVKPATAIVTPAPEPVAEAPLVETVLATSVAPTSDPALTNRVIGLEARLAAQETQMAALRAELAGLRAASIAAGRQWVAGLESK